MQLQAVNSTKLERTAQHELPEVPSKTSFAVGAQWKPDPKAVLSVSPLPPVTGNNCDSASQRAVPGRRDHVRSVTQHHSTVLSQIAERSRVFFYVVTNETT
ncbi:hypothetical protein, variant [Puccinia striiformis f. sp. tritici PST-78]|uniref:Uncharacterized protein n=3 Tax=Puccinia striiformis TaxID=27350 RepID=A0A0L0W4X4_9BASI|nr:hypothetical protein PSTG_00227 [Puccinia striiformis f. sp. tritici PST-78]KNF06340.1 hypothetical protein, variant [Puccinia striiformis f. sp. tritici PST-78]